MSNSLTHYTTLFIRSHYTLTHYTTFFATHHTILLRYFAQHTTYVTLLATFSHNSLSGKLSRSSMLTLMIALAGLTMNQVERVSVRVLRGALSQFLHLTSMCNNNSDTKKHILHFLYITAIVIYLSIFYSLSLHKAYTTIDSLHSLYLFLLFNCAIFINNYLRNFTSLSIIIFLFLAFLHSTLY